MLVVDDDEATAALLQRYLSDAGYRAVRATSGRDAIAGIATVVPDVIVLDAMMPEMDGFVVIAALRDNARSQRIPVVMVTALEDQSTRMRALNSGAADYLTKPVDRAELLVRIRNLLQAQAFATEQVRFKDDFLSHVSHELRSPLTAIKQFTSILLRGHAGALTSEQRELQEIVLRNVHQLQALIDDLVEVTRLEAGKVTIHPVPIKISRTVHDVLDTMSSAAAARDIQLTAELACVIPRVMADPVRLQQIFVILLDNAIKFSPRGEEGRVVAAADSDRRVRIDIEDRGVGMSPDVVARVFDRMFQAPDAQSESRKGLGLGLYIARSLTHRLGGTLTVSSKLGGGTVFTLMMPAFALEPIIAPFVSGAWLTSPVSVLDVHARVDPERATSSAQAESWPGIAREVVTRCLISTSDVLFDQRTDAPWSEHFFIAAAAGAHGASVLADRISGELAGHPDLGAAGIKAAVTISELPGMAALPALPPAARVARVADILTAATTSHHRPSEPYQ